MSDPANEDACAFVLPDVLISLKDGYGLTKLEYAAIHIAGHVSETLASYNAEEIAKYSVAVARAVLTEANKF